MIFRANIQQIYNKYTTNIIIFLQLYLFFIIGMLLKHDFIEIKY